MASVMHALSKPRLIVGLDVGTTFSGFAFAHTGNPENIFIYYDYPKTAGEKPYCKTLTASYYKHVSGRGGWQLDSWGYPARDAVSKRRRSTAPSDDQLQSNIGEYLTRFKLHLARTGTGASSASPLPAGLSVERVITDYLREMGALALRHLQDKFGGHVGLEVIQWCITVPSIWDNSAKASMKSCMAAAGLVQGINGSPHPVIVVLEPEAASFYCHKVMVEQILEVGDKLLVADIGGGTSDIVVQEVVSIDRSFRVKEVTKSSGGLCGGTYVDVRFMEFLHRRIGPCLAECIRNHPLVYTQLMKEWETAKTGFGNMKGEILDFNLPRRLAVEWERCQGDSAKDQSYDDVGISYEEMLSIFDPVVEQNLELIARQLHDARGAVKVVVVVGGFAESPYLLSRVKGRFSKQVAHIISPPNPGSAVCQGAVALALNPDALVSRICRRTYGFEVYEEFEQGIDPDKYSFMWNGVQQCNHRFKILVRKGDELKVDDCRSSLRCPKLHDQEYCTFRLFSSDERNPRYTVGELVKEEGEITLDISGDMKLDRMRNMKVSLFFGGSSLEVKAEAMNFLAEQSQIPVAVDYLLS